MALLDCPFPDGYFTVPNDESGEKRKITFPMISPMILVNAVYTIIDSFTTDSNSVMKYIQTVYTSSGGMVRSSAMAWMYFLLVMLILALLGGIFSAFVFYQKRDA